MTARPNRRLVRWAVTAVVIGAALIAVGVASRTWFAAEKGWPSAQGRVIAVREVSTTHRSSTTTQFSEVVAYVVDGQEYHVESGTRTSDPAVVGSPRVVRYDPATPGRSSIVGDREAGADKVTGFGIIAIVLGVVAVPVGIGWNLFMGRLRRR